MTNRGRPPKLKDPGPGAERAVVVVPQALSGERIDKALAALVPGLSRSFARKILGMGGVHHGDARCRVASREVAVGDVLTATWHREVTAAELFELCVVHEDARVAVVHKPAGQLSQGSELGDVGSVVWALRRRFGRDARLMHRLDKPASGLLLVGLDAAAVRRLAPQIREHTVGRRYYAVTAGVPAQGRCELPLAREGRRMRVAQPGEQGALDARSVVEVIATAGGRALARVTLETGRTHQIRLHLSAVGAPIVGDRRYGGPAASRLCLHAAHLAFDHPDGGRPAFDLAPGDDFWDAAGPGLREALAALDA